MSLGWRVNVSCVCVSPTTHPPTHPPTHRGKAANLRVWFFFAREQAKKNRGRGKKDEKGRGFSCWGATGVGYWLFGCLPPLWVCVVFVVCACGGWVGGLCLVWCTLEAGVGGKVRGSQERARSRKEGIKSAKQVRVGIWFFDFVMFILLGSYPTHPPTQTNRALCHTACTSMSSSNASIIRTNLPPSSSSSSTSTQVVGT